MEFSYSVFVFDGWVTWEAGELSGDQPAVDLVQAAVEQAERDGVVVYLSAYGWADRLYMKDAVFSQLFFFQELDIDPLDEAEFRGQIAPAAIVPPNATP